MEKQETKKNVKGKVKLAGAVIGTAVVTTLVVGAIYNKKIKAVHFKRFYEGEVVMRNFLTDAIPDMTFDKMEEIIETFASKNNIELVSANDILK